MGKTQAEIQKTYRERKKLNEGVKYLDRESKRVMKYYTPVTDLSKKKAIERRQKIREYVRKHRQKIKEQRAVQLPQEPQISDVGESNIQIAHVSSSTDDRPCYSRLIVKFPSMDPKKRTRKRIGRSTSKSRRVIKKLEVENKNLQRKYKKVSKRYERLSKKTKFDNPLQLCVSTNLNDPMNQRVNMTPRKRALQDIRDQGLSPSKIPKVLKEKVIVANVIAQEINDAYKANDQTGKKVVKDIVFGYHVKKYRMKKAVSQALGVTLKKIKKTSKSIQLQKATRNQKTMITIKNRVKEFLYRDDNSRIMPGKNDKVKKKDGYVQKRVLNDTLSYLHLKYNVETTRKISLATFCRMRPKEVSLTKFLSRNKCLCQKHQNMALLLKAMKNAGVNVTINPDEFGRKIKERNHSIEEYLHEIKEETVILQQWKKVELLDGRKKTKVVEEKIAKKEFIEKAENQASDFIEHCDRVKAQYKAIGNLKDNLPDGHCLMQMDFAENFMCTSADEVQSAYWNRTAVTLHPIVIYFRKDDTLQHQNYVIVSDDLGHNIGLVYAILKDVVKKVKEVVPNLRYIHYWTDSPSSQYRNKTAFYIISDHTNLLGVPASWNYFETGHGKGPCDGVGGTSKRAADMGIKQEKFVIQDASDFYINVGGHHKSATYMFVSSSQAEVARQELAKLNKNLTVLKGTMKVHHVTALEKGKVRISVTSCYCESCLNGENHTGTIGSILKQSQEEISSRVPTTENEELQYTVQSSGNVEVASHTESEKDRRRIPCRYEKGDWIVVFYEQKWHIGQIKSVDQEDGEYEVSFLRESGGRSTESTYKWPEPADILDIPHSDVLCKINDPEKVGRSGRSLKLNVEDIEKIQSMLSND